MSTTAPTNSLTPESRQRATMVGAAAIVVLVLVVGCPSLFTRDLWNPDEPRYMEVAREMVVLGDYVVPHLNGAIYAEKPPMFFWLAGLLWRAGVSYQSGRVVTIAAVCGALLLGFHLGKRWLGAQGAVLSMGAALSTFIMLSFTKMGVLDPLLTLFIVASIVSGFGALHDSGRRAAALWAICYAAMGLATLTKGPVGLLVPGLILLAYALMNRRQVRGGGKAHLLGLAVFTAIVLAWVVPAALSGGPEYTRTILLKQNVGRAVRSYSHRNPAHYYLLRWPLYFFPWSLVLPFALVAAFRQWRRQGDRLPLLAALWFLVPLVFFSLISGKRINYVVPAAPAVGLLVGWFLARSSEDVRWLPRVEKWAMTAGLLFTAFIAATSMVGMFLMPAAVERAYPGEGLTARIAAAHTPLWLAASLVALALPLVLALRAAFLPGEMRTRRAVALIAAYVLLSVSSDLFILPTANMFKSGRPFAAAVEQQVREGDVLYVYGDAYSGVYNLYTGRVHMAVIEEPEELRQVLGRESALVICDLRRVRDVLGHDDQQRHVVARKNVGHREMALLRGGPAFAQIPVREGNG